MIEPALMRRLLTVAVVVAGCAGRPAAIDPRDTPPSKVGEKAEMSDAAQADGGGPGTLCTDLPCLAGHEGAMVVIEGIFVFPINPKRKGQHRYTLTLADGTTVVLPRPTGDAMNALLSRANDGKRVSARGRIYIGDIPEQYGIFARTPDPYLVDVVDVAVL